MPAAKTNARLRFRVEEFEAIAAKLKLQTDPQKARYLGIEPGHYSRVATGQSLPGEAFVASVLRALPEIAFERLFEVVEVDR